MWHVVSLGLGLAFILFEQRDQWFFFDEFAFIEPHGSGIWDQHVGHWSTAPWLIYKALLHTVGMASYWPYAIAITLLHLAAAHLAWRIAMRSGADGWIATCATAVFIVFGSGAENILWAFQIGFVGALVFGLLAFLLAMRPDQSWWRLAAITAVSAFSLTWSGTAIPLVVATAALLLVRHGWRRALVYTAINGAIYLAWYLQFAIGRGPDTGGLDPEKLFVLMPLFLGVMLVFGFAGVFPTPTIPSPNPDSAIVPDQIPIPIIGVAVLVGAAVWLVRSLVKRVDLERRGPAFVLVGGAAVFALMTAFNRAAIGWTAGDASRYVYLIALLMLPALVLALGAAVASLVGRDPAARRWVLPVACALLLALAGDQAYLLDSEARSQAIREQQTRRILDAEIALVERGEPGLDPGATVEQWAPDLQLGELIELYEDGIYLPGGYGPADLEIARSYVVRR